MTDTKKSLHDFTFQSIDGKPMPLSQFKGKVVLLVNTASECGYTGQYEGLEQLWLANRDKGLVIVGAPSNDFGGQEPGTNEEIKQFCSSKFDVCSSDLSLYLRHTASSPEYCGVKPHFDATFTMSSGLPA